MVRLPVAHCELNPIEMAWADVKRYIKDNNKKYVVLLCINITLDLLLKVL